MFPISKSVYYITVCKKVYNDCTYQEDMYYSSKLNNSSSYMQKSVLEVHIFNKNIQITRAQLMLLYMIESHFYLLKET